MLERDKEYYNQKISELYAVIENQEKIIRDLQEEIILLKEHLKAERKDANEVQERIDKAIEYIEENIYFCENDSQGAYDVCNIRIASDKKLLEILRGEKNE